MTVLCGTMRQYIMNPAVLRQRVIVEIVFRDKSFCDHFLVILRNGSIRTGDRVVQMDLYFEDARRAKAYLQRKVERTILKWADVDIDCP